MGNAANRRTQQPVVAPRALSGRGAHLLAVRSLKGRALWRQISSIVLQELAQYLQGLVFGAMTVVVPVGRFQGTRAIVCGDEIFAADSTHRCLAVYGDDGALRRRIGVGELAHAAGLAAVDDVVYVVDHEQSRVAVYPRAPGGARVRTLGVDPDTAGRQPGLWDVAVCGGRVYATSKTNSWVSVFWDRDGTFVGRVETGWRWSAVATNDGEAFVVGNDTRNSTQLSRAILSPVGFELELRADSEYSGFIAGVCAAFGLLFLADRYRRRVAVLDAADGRLVAVTGILPGNGEVFSVAVREDSDTLFVVTWPQTQGRRLSQLLAVQLS